MITQQTAKSLMVMGTGEYLPQWVVQSSDIDQSLGLKEGYTEQLSGVAFRRFAGEESASSMAVKAIEQALEASQLSINDIDLIIAACGTMEQSIPCNAAKVHALLKPNKNIPAFDINMTCLSALSAMDLGASLLQQQQYKHILIVSSDIASVGLDWSQLETASIFGDGAAAYVISKPENDNQRIIASLFKTYSDGVDFCEIKGGGSLHHPCKEIGDYSHFGKFEMKGKEVYRMAAKILPEFVDELLTQSKLTVDDIDWVVPHQASHLALKHIQKRLKIPKGKLIEILNTRGNQIAASIPAALNELIRNHPIKTGDKILFVGTSAGFSAGGIILEY